MTALEPSLRSLSTSLLAVTKTRSTLIDSLKELAAAVAALEVCELSLPAKRALEGLENLKAKLLRIQEDLASAGESTLASVVEGWVRLAGLSVKNALASRLRCWTAWQKQLGVVKTLKAALEKRKHQGLVIQSSLAEIVDAERRAEDLKREFEDVTKLIKSEMLRFDLEKVDDFKNGLIEYVDGLTKKQAEVRSSTIVTLIGS